MLCFMLVLAHKVEDKKALHTHSFNFFRHNDHRTGILNEIGFAMQLCMRIFIGDTFSLSKRLLQSERDLEHPLEVDRFV
jgi:hypothetical protein